MPKMTLGRTPKVHARSASPAVANARQSTSPVNIPLFAIVAALVAIGLVTVYSVTLTNAEYNFWRQVIGIVIGIVLMVLLWLFDYRQFGSCFVPLLVIDCLLIMLPMIPGLGIEVNGATSWIKIGPLTAQPSEWAKPVTILMMAAGCARFDGEISKGTDYLKLVGCLLLPCVLLIREDLGSTLVLLVIGFFILFVGGASRRWIIVTLLTLVVIVAGGLGLNSALNTWSGGDIQILKPYQMSRLLVFIDQDNPDYADDAYNLNQAKIAVGSGEITGKGFGNATQSSGGFLPEAATDFIFCVYAEQFGFMGALVLLALYLALMAVALTIGLHASDKLGSCIVAGVMSMWLFQILENIGMDLGLMPITGIPLPFMSYGSSFMLTNFICIGLLCSIWSRRLDVSNRTRKVASR